MDAWFLKLKYTYYIILHVTSYKKSLDHLCCMLGGRRVLHLPVYVQYGGDSCLKVVSTRGGEVGGVDGKHSTLHR